MVKFVSVSLPEIWNKEGERAKSLVQDGVKPRLEEIDVEPPTARSLQAAKEVGIMLGRQLNRNKISEYAGDTALQGAKKQIVSLFEDGRGQNCTVLIEATSEAYIASEFKHVSPGFGVGQ